MCLSVELVITSPHVRVGSVHCKGFTPTVLNISLSTFQVHTFLESCLIFLKGAAMSWLVFMLLYRRVSGESTVFRDTAS